MYRLGGTARGYQGIFTTLAAQQSRLRPNRTGGPAVYLYIAALGVNVLNCLDEGVRTTTDYWGTSAAWRIRRMDSSLAGGALGCSARLRADRLRAVGWG